MGGAKWGSVAPNCHPRVAICRQLGFGSRRSLPGDPMPRTRHGLHVMRRTLTTLTIRRLDGRSAIAVAVRKWKADVTADLGGDLSRAELTLLEAAAQKLVLRD